MPYLIAYFLKLSISLTVVYGVYWLFLRWLTFYRWNRFYLMVYSLAAFLIPFIDITGLLEQNGLQTSGVVSSIQPLSFFQNNAAPISSPETSYEVWTIGIFAAGMIILAFRLGVQYFSLRRIRRSAVLLSNASLRLYHIDQHIMPFSFGDAIYVNQHLHNETELKEIIRHEFIHVRERHSIDILFGECLCMINWLNPFSWLIRNAIRQNLEFIADNTLIKNGVDKKQYQYLLLKVMGKSPLQIASGFNFSSLKKRIAMMNKQKSTKITLLRFLFILPLVCIILLAFRENHAILSKRVNDNVVKSNSVNDGDLPGGVEGKYGKVPASGHSSFQFNRSLISTSDTVPVPPPPPPTVKFPKNVISINITDNRKATVKLKDGESEKYDLDKPSEKDAFEKKYGAILPPTVSPVMMEAATAATLPSPPIIEIPKDYRDFLRRNSDVENVLFMDYPHRIVIKLQNGKKEIYNLEDENEVKRAEGKYGKLPIAPPPPPTPPHPPVPPSVAITTTNSTIRNSVSATLAESTRSSAVAPAEAGNVYLTDHTKAFTSNPGSQIHQSGQIAMIGGRTIVSSDEGTVIGQDGSIISKPIELELLAQIRKNDTKEDLDKIIKDLQDIGCVFSISNVNFTDGKLTAISASIKKGDHITSFTASDFGKLVISISKKKNSITGFHIIQMQ